MGLFSSGAPLRCHLKAPLIKSILLETEFLFVLLMAPLEVSGTLTKEGSFSSSIKDQEESGSTWNTKGTC